MNPESFRFRPPAYELPGELLWVLARAFGPLPGYPLELAQPERVRHWAAVLKLQERIASRMPRPAAERQLPGEIVEALWLGREALAARTLLLRQLLERVVARARELEIRVVALKGIALLESGACDWGARPLLDVDLLIGGERADELQAALEADGFERTGPAERHHLATLADRSLGQVELHTHLPGVLLGDGRPAGMGDLDGAAPPRPSEHLPGLELPPPEVLAAHGLAHALDQHGLSPTAYPVTRLVGDLLDLAASTDTPLPEVVRPARAWLRSSVSERELGAVEALCSALEGGEPEGAGEDGNALLRHTALAFASPRYRRLQRRRAAWRAVRRGHWSKFRSEVSRRLRGRFGLS